ncbi:hypothetical protein [Mesorhizobium erdmanii]|nr:MULTISPECIES: hypothetical protein [Mesorhizobium]
MQHVSIARVGEEIRRRLSELPKKRYLIAAAVFVVLAALGKLMGGPEALQALCNQIVSDLGNIQPLNMVSRYFANLAACDTVNGYAGDYVNCSSLRFIDPRRFLGSLLYTLGDVWSDSGVPGRIILPFALIAGFPIAMSIVWPIGKIFGDGISGVVRLVLGALVTPFIASVIALLLQVVALVLFTIFGVTLGLIAWLGTVFGGVWSLWKLVSDIKESAEKMEHVVGALAVVTAEPPPNNVKPD